MRSGIHEFRFFLSNFHASRSSFSPYHASRINPLPPSKEMTKDTEGTVEIGNSKNPCDQFIASAYTLRTVK